MARSVCVLGMSRAGTSLSARLLDLMGVYLGGEDDLLGGELSQIPGHSREKARAANAAGFWEHYGLMRLNERILRRLGGNWREPPSPPPGWEAAAELDEERAEARQVLAETFSGCGLWGWKDPRNSLTLPFWRALVPQLHCVICLRNPLDVAASLQRREGMPEAEALELWLLYMRSALVHSEGRPRVVVAYEDYFAEPARPLAALAQVAGTPPPVPGSQRAAAIEAAIRDDLRHHRSSPAAALDGERVPAPVAAVYRAVDRLRSGAPVAAEAQSS